MSIEELVHYALSNGIVMACKPAFGSNVDYLKRPCKHAPITKEPFPFPREAFEKSVQWAPLFNLLVERISRDTDWLISELEETAKVLKCFLSNYKSFF